MRPGVKARVAAASALDAVVGDGKSLDWALAQNDESLALNDRSMMRMLCYGCLRHHWQLRDQLAQLLDRPLKKRDRIIESLLVVGLFQLSDTRIPDHAAVSATVEATRALSRPKMAGLVNAVLRNFLRKKVVHKELINDEARYNHPQWLLERMRADWPDDWQQIIAANNAQAPMWLRVNPRFGTAEKYQQTHVVEGALVAGLEQALRLDVPQSVDDLPGFFEGQVSVQDGAAQIAAPWLLADGSGRVLDACAAPGGKTGQLLELMGDEGNLTAIDSNENRLTGIRENLTRLGLRATVLAADASNAQEWWDGEPFDQILLDAPCSATGVIRRHPDIKLLRRETDLATLATLQERILNSLWPLLSPGGRLLYVTCSVLSEENEAVIRRFLAGQNDAVEDRVLHAYNIRDLMVEKALGFQVLPGTEGLDGFYFACLEKSSE
jgi:16S rRNA (cytosine967-C5)-methyltransferase